MLPKIVRIHKGLQIMNFSFSLGAKGKLGKQVKILGTIFFLPEYTFSSLVKIIYF
jgi:hypothetical protein